jgi:hypothetical protein
MSEGLATVLVGGFVSIVIAFIAQAAGLIALWMNQRRTQESVDHNTAVTQTVHALVNNAMGVQLKTTANALRALANITHDPRDLKAAADAVRLYDEHIRGQEALNEAVQEKISPPPLPGLPESRRPPLPPFPMH